MSANPIVHWELMGPDDAELEVFYSKIFDWSFGQMDGFEGYHMTEGEEMGVNGAVGQGSEDLPAYQAIYVGVEDIDAKLGEVKDAGGTVVVPRTAIPDVVTYALFRDPAGNLVGVVESDG